MKKLVFLVTTIIIFVVTQSNADNNKSMSNEEFLKQMEQLDQEEKKVDANIEKAEKFHKILETFSIKLETEKLERKQKENQK